MSDQVATKTPGVERLLRDLSPATVRLATGQMIRDARVIITSERAFVIASDSKTEWHHVISFDLCDPLPTAKASQYLLKTESLELYGLVTNAIVTKGYGCGCDGASRAPLPTMRGTEK